MAIEGKLTAQSSVSGQNKFGYSFDITTDGNTIVVGVPQPALYLNQVPGPSIGQVHSFNRTIPAWALASAYTKGDIVRKEGILYIANENIPANTSFTTGQTGNTWKPTSGNIWNRTATYDRSSLPNNTGGEEEKYYPHEFFNFGHSVSISNNNSIAVVGSRYASVGNENFAGQVTIYTDSYSTVTTLNPSSPQYNARFGDSVSLSGDSKKLVVGAPGTIQNSLEGVGAAHIYFRVDNTTVSPTTYSWVRQDTFVPGTDAIANMNYGNTVAMNYSGNTVVIGAPGLDSLNIPKNGGPPNKNIGEAYIYKLESPTSFKGYISGSSANLTVVSGVTGGVIKSKQFIDSSATGMINGTRVVAQTSSLEAPTQIFLAGFAGAKTVSVASNATSIQQGYSVSCATAGRVNQATYVTGIVGSTVYLSVPLTGNVVGLTLQFENSFSSIVSSPIVDNNTVIVDDYSSLARGDFFDTLAVTDRKIKDIKFNTITLESGTITNTTTDKVGHKVAGKTGVYTLNNTYSNAVGGSAPADLKDFTAAAWVEAPVEVRTPSEIPDGYFGDSIAIDNSGNRIVIGSANGAFVFDNTGTLLTQLIPDGLAPGDTFGKSVDISADGTIITVGAPNKRIAIVDAKDVWTDGKHELLYEITSKGTADWASLGIKRATFDIAHIYAPNVAANIMFVKNVSEAKLITGTYLVGSDIPAGTRIVSQYNPLDTNFVNKVNSELGLTGSAAYVLSNVAATAGTPANTISKPTWGGNGIYLIDGLPTGWSSKTTVQKNTYTATGVVCATIADPNNISEGSRFYATANASPDIGTGKAISYANVGIANAGAVLKFVSADASWTKWEQVRTFVVESNDTQWNKLGETVKVSSDGTTIAASSTGVELFGRTNEGAVYVFSTK
jgi:hypothetical protein